MNEDFLRDIVRKLDSMQIDINNIKEKLDVQSDVADVKIEEIDKLTEDKKTLLRSLGI